MRWQYFSTSPWITAHRSANASREILSWSEVENKLKRLNSARAVRMQKFDFRLIRLGHARDLATLHWYSNESTPEVALVFSFSNSGIDSM